MTKKKKLTPEEYKVIARKKGEWMLKCLERDKLKKEEELLESWFGYAHDERFCDARINITKDTKLFQEESEFGVGAWIKVPASKDVMYSDGYSQAARIIYDSISEKKGNSNFLVYPLIFIYRQCLELKLKELIRAGFKVLNNELKQEIEPQLKTFNNGEIEKVHKLNLLWNDVKILASGLKFEQDEEWKEAEIILNQFHEEDPNGVSFRFPYSHNWKTIKNTIDLYHFASLMDITILFLDGIRDLVYEIEEA
ncbi:hypothetical protein [Aegicerativicinus sediminis]|uniref:hypothetical protein n=1 Tax=Aegicerativicinus sediminis TaxID=2893202 RepID=UPI001E4B39E6|nr:hypothetical protein [Aegicerativicinus sediminis]